MSGLQCEKRLWLEVHRPELKSEPTITQARVLATGTAVGEEARKRFAGGVLVTAPFYDLDGAVRETAGILRDTGVAHVFEAAFQPGIVHVKVDVLSRTAAGAWHLIEVKSTSSVKIEHLADVATQWCVVEEAGLRVARCSIMHLNRDCRYPNLQDLFTVEDVTDRARPLLSEVPAWVRRMEEVLDLTAEPAVSVGTQCTTPYECPFRDYCWKDIPRQSVFTIPRLDAAVKNALAAAGILRISDVPKDQLTGTQATYVDMIVSGEPRIQRTPIKEALDALEYPLWFLDFETCADAIPRFPGLGPWGNYPFQYSLHVLEADGTVTHREYLHEDQTDPRPALARSLCRDIGPTGTLVAYNAAFEKGVIAALAALLPEHRRHLEGMVGRFFDLLAIFRDYFAHPDFLGSNSIKHVLPVLVPDLSYEHLAVADGQQAQTVWASLIGTAPDDDTGRGRRRADAGLGQGTFGFEREATIAHLKEYCRMDTLAMVRIFEALRRL